MRDALRFWFNHRSQATWLVVAVGLAAGVTAATVVVIQGLFWKRLPFSDPDRVVVVRPTNARDQLMDGFWADEYIAWQSRQQIFTRLGAYQFGFPAALWLGDHAESINTLWVTTSLFDVLGVTPLAGRLFGPVDVPNGQDEVAILGNRAWRRWFGGRPDVIGARVRISTSGNPWSATIVGVLPAGVEVEGFSAFGNDLFLPVTDGPLPPAASTRGWNLRTLVARLPDTLTQEDATRRASELVRQIAQHTPAGSARAGVRLTTLRDDLYGSNRSLVILLVVAAGFVLAVACANAAGVLLTLANLRTREFSVRAALGASRRHILRLLLAEGGLLAAGSAVLTAVVMSLLVGLVVALAPSEVRGLSEISVSWRGLLASAGLGGFLALSLCFISMVPWSSTDPHEPLHASRVATTPRAALRVRALLLGTQVAVILALVVGAGLMISTLWQLTHRPLGFSAEGVAMAEIAVTRQYSSNLPRYQQLLRDLQNAAVKSGVSQAALSFDVPLASSAGGGRIAITLPDGGRRSVRYNMVSPGFFAVLQIPFLAGRDFRADEYAGGHFTIVNRAFAEAYLGGTLQAVGRRYSFGRGEQEEIVGVVGDIRDVELVKPIEPAIYNLFPTDFFKPGRVFLLARSATGPVRSDLLSRAVRAVDPNLVVRDGRLSDRFQEQTALTRMQAILMGLLATCTLLLAGIGVYALVTQLTHARMRELGIRAALGATPVRLVWLPMLAVTAPAVGGALAGLVASWALVRLLRQFLFETHPFDPVLWAGAVVLLLMTICIAAWLPARRAGLLNPAEVLRRE